MASVLGNLIRGDQEDGEDDILSAEMAMEAMNKPAVRVCSYAYAAACRMTHGGVCLRRACFSFPRACHYLLLILMSLLAFVTLAVWV